MSRFRALKNSLETLLLPPAWPLDSEVVPDGAANLKGLEAVSPLLSMLPKDGVRKWRAVLLLGRVVADLAAADMEKARTVMRRCMWHLNEDSGNLGWGVAEAMGEIAAQSPVLAKEYGRVILSYVRDTGVADNYIDHAPLRRGAYWAVARLAPEYPEYHQKGLELLVQGLSDEDSTSRGIAAWGIGRLAAKGFPPPPERDGLATLLRLELGNQGTCEILDGTRVRQDAASILVREALAKVMESWE